MLVDLLERFDKAFDAITGASSSFMADDWGEKPQALPPEAPDGVQLSNGKVLVNGVELPQLVIDQIKLAGFNPDWCNHYELEAAKRAAAVDCQVFDEPGATDFYDGLELDSDEEKALTEKYTISPQNDILERAMTFCDRIKQERQRSQNSHFSSAEQLYACSA